MKSGIISMAIGSILCVDRYITLSYNKMTVV